MKLAAFAVLCACSPTAPKTEAEPEAEVVKAEVVEKAEVVTKADAVVKTAVEPEPAPAPEPSPSFHLVAKVEPYERDERAPHFRVFEAAGGELFASAGPQLVRIGDDGSLERDVAWLNGIETFGPDENRQESVSALVTWDVVTAGGRWPNAFYITVTAEFGFRSEGYPNRVYRREGDRWQPVKTKSNTFKWFVSDTAPWRDGSVLALRGFTALYEYQHNDQEDFAEPTPASMRRADAAIAGQRPLIVIRGAPKAPDFGRHRLAAFDALESGEIVGVVIADTPLAVHYDPVGDRVTAHELPEGNPDYADVVLESAARAWIYGRVDETPYLARFDGEAWTKEPAPGCVDTGIGSLSRTPEGDAWAVCGRSPDTPLFDGETNALWHRPAETAEWQRVALPDGMMPTEVLARGRGDIWLGGTSLYHTKPRDRVATMPGYGEMWIDIEERAQPAKTFSCDEATIFIEGAPKEEHADLAAKLGAIPPAGGTALVEVAFRGEPRLALQHHAAPEPEVQKKLREVLGARMLESYCFMREPTREIATW